MTGGVKLILLQLSYVPGVVDPDMRKKEFIAFSMSEWCGGKEGGLGELKINDWHI